MRVIVWNMLGIYALCLVIEYGYCEDPKRLTVALIIDGQHSGSYSSDGNEERASNQLEAAAFWATEVINNQSGPFHSKIDIKPVRGFVSKADAVTILNDLMKKENGTSPVIGAIGVGDPKLLRDVASVLAANDVVLMTASPRATENLLHESNSAQYVVAAAPGVEAVARATVAVAKALRAKSLRLVGTCTQALQEATKISRRLAIPVTDVHLIEEDALLTSDGGVFKDLLGLPDQDQAIAAFLEPHEMARLVILLERHSNYQSEQSTWLLGCLGSVDKVAARDWSMNLGTTHFLIEPHMPVLEGFKDYYMQSNEKSLQKNFKQEPEVPYIVRAMSTLGAAVQLMDMNNCSQISYLHNNTIEQLSIPCASSMDNITLQRRLLRELKKLSLPLSKTSQWGPREISGVTRHISHNGKLSNNGYLVYRLSPGGDELDPAAWYSDEEGLVLAAISHTSNGRSFVFGHTHSGPPLSAVPSFQGPEEVGEFENSVETLSTQSSKFSTGKGVIIPIDPESNKELIELEETESVRPIIIRKNDQRRKSPFLPPIPKIVRKKDLITNQSSERRISEFLEESQLVAARPLAEISMSKTWAAALIAVAVTVMLGTFYVMSFITMRICQGSLAGHQGFTYLLLFSIIGMCSIVLLYVLAPSENICALRVFLTPLALSISYSLLLVQLMYINCQRLAFNIASTVSGGRHSRTPSFPLYVTLFLALAVQIAISSGWYSHQDPRLSYMLEEGGCPATPEDLACLHVYPLVLLLIVTVYGVILRSKQEARWITVAALSSTPFLIVWGMMCFLAPDGIMEISTSLLLIILSSVLLGTIFIPKIHGMTRAPPKTVKMSPFVKKVENPMGLSRTLPFVKRDPIILNIETLKPRAVANRYYPFTEITPRNASLPSTSRNTPSKYTLPRTMPEPQTPKKSQASSPHRMSPFQEVPPPYRRTPPADLASSSTATFKSYRRSSTHRLGFDI